MPQYDYHCLRDNTRAPYRPHSFDVVYEFMRQAVVKPFQMGCHLIIIGCNTVSAKAQQKKMQAITTKVPDVIKQVGKAGGYKQKLGLK